jgi:adenylate cyclase
LGITGANVVGALCVYAFLQFALADPDTGELGESPMWAKIVVHSVLGLLACVLGNILGGRASRDLVRWVGEDRAPTDAERRATLAQPFRQAVISFGMWMVAALTYPTASILFLGDDATTALRMFDAIAFGGLTTTAIVYLLVERALRPAFATVLAGEPPDRPASLGVRTRFMLVWALGSGVALFGVAVAPTAIETPDWEVPVTILGVLGLLAGAGTMLIAARAVADPLDELTQAMAKVEQGELDASVAVDDGGDIGMLQAGFNRMVTGLVERERLRDLFGRQVGEQVARLAIEQGVDLGGDQVDASALFVDLVGSTALAQDRPPKQVLSLLNQLFATTIRVVGEEGGYVSRFEGDGALCVFGVPVAQPGHATRALRAARRLATALEGEGIAAGIGVSSGTVVAGNVGTTERYEFTVIGDAVNEAARLTDEAKHRPGHALASEATVARADVEALNWVAADELVLRGRGVATRAFAPSTTTVYDTAR